MSDITSLHHRAMEVMDEADSIQRQHRAAMALAAPAMYGTATPEEARVLYCRAYVLEIQAAQKVRMGCEPTRSVLYRSAASLAFCAGEYESAIAAVDMGLTDHTHDEIRAELLDVRRMAEKAKKGQQNA